MLRCCLQSGAASNVTEARAEYRKSKVPSLTRRRRRALSSGIGASTSSSCPSAAASMESHHASLGRRTLEELRQKRAAERLHRASSGSESESTNSYGILRSESGNRVGEKDLNAFLVRVKELEVKNAELEKENRKLLSKLEEKEIENDSLMKRLNDLEQNTLPSLRKAVKDVSIEKDAAIVAREDALSQLRTIKKRLKEAEEDQYRAEEDAAVLRAELNSLQRQGMGNSFSSVPMGNSSEHILSLEKEIMNLQSELQQISVLRQEEQHKLADEQLRTSSLMVEKQVLEDKIAALSSKASEEASEAAASKVLSRQDKEKFEKQLHDMAVMVERLEGSRQKLLAEIDSQSSEIERLFEENSNLSTSYQEALEVAAQWENQVKDCLKQNGELRHLLDKLRLEQSNAQTSSDRNVETVESIGKNSALPESAAEILLLKDQLTKEQSRAEALVAEVMKLSAELKRAAQAQNNLTRLYRPVLRNIENSLMKMKQESFVTID